MDSKSRRKVTKWCLFEVVVEEESVLGVSLEDLLCEMNFGDWDFEIG